MTLRRQITTAAIAITGLLSFSYAQAEGAKESYFGLGASQQQFDPDGPETVTATGRLGTYFNNNVSAELRLGLGVDGERFVDEGDQIDFDSDRTVGAYLRLGSPMKTFYPYILVGMTSIKIEISSPDIAGSFTDEESDMSYGAGVDFPVATDVLINAEYASLFDKDGVEVTAISLGLTRHF